MTPNSLLAAHMLKTTCDIGAQVQTTTNTNFQICDLDVLRPSGTPNCRYLPFPMFHPYTKYENSRFKTFLSHRSTKKLGERTDRRMDGKNNVITIR